MTDVQTEPTAAERHALAMLDLATAVYHAPNATLSAVAAAGYRAALRDVTVHFWIVAARKHLSITDINDAIDAFAAARGIDLTETAQ